MFKFSKVDTSFIPKSMKIWPKPIWFPYLTASYLCINLLFTYILFYVGADPLFMSPSWVLNILFYWAERVDYIRESRNFEGWVEELREAMYPKEARAQLWSNNLAAIRPVRTERRKRNR